MYLVTRALLSLKQNVPQVVEGRYKKEKPRPIKNPQQVWNTVKLSVKQHTTIDPMDMSAPNHPVHLQPIISQANFIIGDICILAVWSYACHRKLYVIALLLRSGLGLNSTWIRYNPGLKILSPLICVALFPVQLRLTLA